MSNLCPARYGFRPKPMLIVCIFSPIRFQSNTFLYDKFHRGKKKKKMTTQPRRPYEKFHSLWFFFFFIGYLSFDILQRTRVIGFHDHAPPPTGYIRVEDEFLRILCWRQ